MSVPSILSEALSGALGRAAQELTPALAYVANGAKVRVKLALEVSSDIPGPIDPWGTALCSGVLELRNGTPCLSIDTPTLSGGLVQRQG